MSSFSNNVLLAAVDPGVKPNNNFFPFMDTLRDGAGGVISVVIVIAVIAFVVGCCMLMWAKVSKSNAAAQVSTSVLIWVTACAALAAGASGLIAWATGLKLF